MDVDVPYLASVKNLHAILDAMQKAAVPEAFGLDFLKDMGFTSSNDRGVIKLLKYLGLLDASARPQTAYREFVDHTKAKLVLAMRTRHAYDDLFKSDKEAHTKSASDLKGWFRTKTGAGDAVAEKMATTFKSLASYADFSGRQHAATDPVDAQGGAATQEKRQGETKKGREEDPPREHPISAEHHPKFALTYRIEIHLPDTTNLDTFRAIFRALREELG